MKTKRDKMDRHVSISPSRAGDNKWVYSVLGLGVWVGTRYTEIGAGCAILGLGVQCWAGLGLCVQNGGWRWRVDTGA